MNISRLKWLVPFLLVSAIIWVVVHVSRKQNVEITLQDDEVHNEQNTLSLQQSVVKHNNPLLHPKSQSDLWIKISKKFIVRRLGYLDYRDERNVSIRLISMHDKREKSTPSIFMSLHYAKDKPSICMATILEAGFLPGRDKHVLYLVHSPSLVAAQTDSLSHVTISTDKSCHHESDTIAIQSVGSEPPKHNFGVCIHKALTLSSNVKSKDILDWVKLNIAMGAELITVYLQVGADKVYDTLRPYINKGIVEVLDWKMEPPLTIDRSYHFGQTGVIAECIWYNINKVRYLALYDADEYIVPLKHKYVNDMLKEIDNVPEASKAASFIFTNTIMKGNGQALPIVQRALDSNKCPSLNRASLPIYFERSLSCLEKSGRAMKMIVKPNGVSAAWGHLVLSYRSDKYTQEYVVPDTMGLSYHYRPDWKGYTGCSSATRETLTIEKYFTNITQCNEV